MTEIRQNAEAAAHEILARTRTILIGPKSSGPTKKAGAIVAEIEHRLITGKYQFRDPLSINRLAEQFDASRKPIGVALNHLYSLGNLDIIPQAGSDAVSSSPSEIDDFFIC